jgi:hypothetical protein
MQFSRAKSDVEDLVEHVMRQHHGPLSDHEVTVGVLMAEDPDAKRDHDDRMRPIPVLKHQGYAAAAVVKITSYRDRVQGLPDAVITIDKGLWGFLKDEEQAALIDHELQHLELQLDDEGHAKSDAQGRPKLKLRLHDVQIGVFDVVIKRHGNAALDTQVVRRVVEAYRQMSFGWADGMAPAAGEAAPEFAMPPGTTMSINGRPVEPGKEAEAVGELVDKAFGGDKPRRRRKAAATA